VDPGVARGGKGSPRTRPQQCVLADQRPVEVAGERLDRGRKVRREF
jgi:hypothetical protein